MSRNIDMSKRLSEEDQEYLLARGREQDVTRNLAEFTDDAEMRRAANYIPGTSIDVADGVPVTEGGDPLVNNGGGITDGVPRFAHRPDQAIPGEAGDAGVGALFVESDEDDEDDEDEDDPADAETEDNYESWDKADLKAELERRELALSGNKKDLVARLRQHDAEQDEDTDEDDDSDEE